MKFITFLSLEKVLTKIKGLFVVKEDGKGLSENDLSNDLKAKYDAAHTHSQAAHAPSGAQANVIESIKVNGVEVAIADKTVDVEVPTKVSEITNDSGFQTAAQVSGSITTALGSYSTTTAMNTAIAAAVADAGHLKREIVDSLPEVGSADERTVYMVLKDDGEDDNVYNEYMVIDGNWEKIGDTKVDLTGYIHEEDIEEVTDAEIDALFDSLFA